MDRLDVGLLKTLLVNNGVPPPGHPVLKKSFRSIAKELGVDQGTIRNRTKRLQEEGVLKGWYLGVNPGFTGQDVIYAWFEVENISEKEGVMRRLLSLPDLERTCNYLGPHLKMVLLCNKGDDVDALMAKLSRLAGFQASERSHAFLEVKARHPKETDLAIMGSLRRDPWKPYPIVARELGLSPRTVKRRVERLSRDGGIYMLPVINMKALQGVIPVDLTVDYLSSTSRVMANAKITEYVKEQLMFSGNIGPRGFFALMVPNISNVEQIVRWVKQQGGVRDVQAYVLQEVVLNPKHFRREHLPGASYTKKESAPRLAKGPSGHRTT